MHMRSSNYRLFAKRLSTFNMKKARLLNLSNLNSLSYIATIMHVLSINEVKSIKQKL